MYKLKREKGVLTELNANALLLKKLKIKTMQHLDLTEKYLTLTNQLD